MNEIYKGQGKSSHRLNIAIQTLSIGSRLIAVQETVGRNGSRCCNKNADGHGCVVGLLVGLDHFEINDSHTVWDLGDKAINDILCKVTGDPRDDTFASLCAADRQSYRKILASMQRIHDYLGGFSHSVGGGIMDHLAANMFSGLTASIAVALILQLDEDFPKAPQFIPVLTEPYNDGVLSMYIDELMNAIRAFVKLK